MTVIVTTGPVNENRDLPSTSFTATTRRKPTTKKRVFNTANGDDIVQGSLMLRMSLCVCVLYCLPFVLLDFLRLTVSDVMRDWKEMVGWIDDVLNDACESNERFFCA